MRRARDSRLISGAAAAGSAAMRNIVPRAWRRINLVTAKRFANFPRPNGGTSACLNEGVYSDTTHVVHTLYYQGGRARLQKMSRTCWAGIESGVPF